MESIKDIKNTATFVIGLGGTGWRTLDKLKDNIREKTSVENIKFLAIDSDFKNYYENCNHSSADGCIALEGSISNDELRIRNEFQWLNKRFLYEDHYFIDCRQFGRVALLKNEIKISFKIKEMMSDWLMNLDDISKINIYFITSSCGTTGSGCLIDMAYIMKNLIAELGIADKAYINALIYLPEIYRDISLSETQYKYIEMNSYALFKELHHLMSLPENGGVFEQKYLSGLKILSDEAPFNICQFVSAPKNADNKPTYVIERVANYILDEHSGIDHTAYNDISTNIELEKLHNYESSYISTIKHTYSVHLYESEKKNWMNLPNIDL